MTPCEFRDYQDKINRERDVAIAEWSEEDKKKFQTVERVLKILNDADIPFWLFPLLPANKEENFLNNTRFWQFNNTQKYLVSQDNEVTLKSQEHLCELNDKIFLMLMANVITPKVVGCVRPDLDWRDPEIFYRVLSSLYHQSMENSYGIKS